MSPRPAPIRLGMVGGGEGAFIGAVHRVAARLDDRYRLVAGALSATPDKALRSAAAIGLERAYPDFATMARAEAARPDGIEAVAIVTPNHLHVPAALAFLGHGIHVICDKPLSTSLAEGRRLAEAVRSSGRIFALTHNYTGYPMIREARALVASGALGDIRVVQVEYAQDWLATPLEADGQKQAAWRTDPARAGAGGALGDIGTHAFQLAGFVTGLVCEAVAADLDAFVPGRSLDDNAHAMLRYRGGAKGLLWASQVATGNENALRLRVFGTRAGLSFEQEHPNQLRLTPLGEPTRVLSRGTGGLSPAAARATRLPPGHPEGYFEAFATLYAEVAEAIVAARGGAAPGPEVVYPGIADGLAGMAFVEAAVASSRAGGVWTPLAA